MRKLLLISSICLLAFGCSKKADNQSVVNNRVINPTITTTPTLVPTATPNPNLVYVEWILTDLPEGKYNQPHSEVSLKLTGFSSQEIDLGQFSNCSLQDKPNEQAAFDDNQLSQLYCWWAGAGDNLTIKSTKANELSVYHQDLGESPSDIKSTEKLIKTIALPQGSIIQMVNE